MTKPQPTDKCILCGKQPKFIGVFTPVASLGIGRAIPYALCDQHGKPGRWPVCRQCHQLAEYLPDGSKRFDIAEINQILRTKQLPKAAVDFLELPTTREIFDKAMGIPSN